MLESKELEIISILSNDGIKFNESYSSKVRQDQLKIMHRLLTISEWENYFMKDYSEKELINNFFGGIRGSYNAFISNLKDKRIMLESVKNHENPLFSDESDVNTFYADEFDGKKSTSEDHQPVIMSNRVPLGTSEYEIEKYLVECGITKQLLSVSGLQGFIASKGGYITADKAYVELQIIKKNLNSFDDDMESLALKRVRSELKKQGVDFGYSNQLGQEMRKNISNNKVYLANFMADLELAKSDPNQKQEKIEKGLKKLLRRALGDGFNIIIEPIAETTVYTGNVLKQDMSDLKQ